MEAKLNKLGKNVLNTLSKACNCWDDVRFFDQFSTDKFYSFDMSEGYGNLHSPIVEKVYSVCDAFEITHDCNVCCSITVKTEGVAIYPVIHISISL